MHKLPTVSIQRYSRPRTWAKSGSVTVQFNCSDSGEHLNLTSLVQVTHVLSDGDDQKQLTVHSDPTITTTSRQLRICTRQSSPDHIADVTGTDHSWVMTIGRLSSSIAPPRSPQDAWCDSGCAAVQLLLCMLTQHWSGNEALATTFTCISSGTTPNSGCKICHWNVRFPVASGPLRVYPCQLNSKKIDGSVSLSCTMRYGLFIHKLVMTKLMRSHFVYMATTQYVAFTFHATRTRTHVECFSKVLLTRVVTPFIFPVSISLVSRQICGFTQSIDSWDRSSPAATMCQCR